MKKNILAICLALLVSTSALAGTINAAVARQKAEAFLKAAGLQTPTDLHDITATTPFTEFYVFTLGEQGFVLVSGADCGQSILGYSMTNRFEVQNMPAHIRAWLDGYETELRQLRQQPSDNPKTGSVAPQPVLTVVPPLMTTTWNQSPYYNTLCPDDTDANERTVTGCVATATAQIMKFWNHPATGHGSHSYTDPNYGLQSADFGATTYAWASMPNSLSAGSTTAQVNAVATLMYHIGVADEMRYGIASTGGSGAQNHNFMGEITPSSQTALMKHFKYCPDMVTLAREDYTNAQYTALLKAELDASRPILFSGHDVGGGHSFVIDGYNSSDQFHVNWGWGSYCDGYYLIGALNPAGSGTGGNNGTYNDLNVALTRIRPNPNFGTGGTVSATVSGNGGTVSGNGSYSFGDTVSLLATAADGYRFAGWTDHERFNPRQLIGNGGNYSFSATFEPIAGDTLSYCGNGRYITSYGMGSAGTLCTWGIKLPASLLTAGSEMSAVQIFIPTAGTYTVTVSTGSTSPSTVQATNTVAFANSNAGTWQTITFATPFSVDATQAIWIVFECSDVAYPAAFTYYSGRSEGFLWGSNLSPWTGISFMIRGIFAAGTPTPPTPPSPPTITIGGPSSLEVNQQGTFRATASDETTIAWTLQGATPASAEGYTVIASWNEAGTYTVIATATNDNGSSSDTLHVTVNALPTFTITTESNDDRMGTVQGGGTYPRGTQITLTAIPNEGYRFLRWHDGQTNPERSLTVMANVTYSAYFAEQVGINGVAAEAVTLAPNPASTSVTIDGLEAGTEVQVIDMQGRIHATLKCQNTKLKVDVSQWPRRAYFVRAATPAGTVIRKMIVR